MTDCDTADKGWGVYDEGDCIHICPMNDMREHYLATDCPCLPKFEQEGTKIIVTHRSYDMRELTEPDTDKRN